MFTDKTSSNSIPRSLKKVAALVAAGSVFGLFSFSASAQSMTPQQFMSACQNNAGNTVQLSQQTKFQGTAWGETYSTLGTCNVVLAPGASLELDYIRFVFGGALNVRGSTEAKIVIDKATIEAASINLNLLGTKSEFQMKEGRVHALAGNFALNFGQLGKMEMLNSGGWTRGGFRSQGSMKITSGAFFSGTVFDSGFEGAKGIQLTLNGEDSSWKIEKTTLNVSNFTFRESNPFTTGDFIINGAGNKAKVEITDSDLRFTSDNITMNLTGVESSLLLKNTTSQTGAKAVYVGATGEKGIVFMEDTLFLGNPDVEVVTGVFGTTAVLGGTLYAQRTVRVKTGQGGSCTVFPSYALSTANLANSSIESCQ
jgi:hypothetical protein